jgi:hypothetical protein
MKGRGTMTSDELRQVDLEAEFPEWTFWRGVNGLPYARRPRTSPPNTMWGEDWTDLRDNVRAWLTARHQG